MATDPNTSLNAETSTPSQTGNDESEQNENGFNVDWDKCLEDLKESVLDQEFFPFAKDIYVVVDEEKEQITFSVVVGDATDPEVALDYADTVIRRYNLMANMQDSSIALGGKDYYGGLYDQYDVLIGVAPQSKTNDTDEWFVFDAVISGAHNEIKLQK